MAATSEQPAAARSRTLLSFVLGAALLAFVLSRLDYGEFVRNLAATRYGAYLAFVLAFNAALVSADALAIRYLYARTICPVSYRDVFVIRAASYLPALLNYHVGQGWMTYFLSRAYGAPLWRVAGATLVVYVTVFGGLYGITLLSVPFNFDRWAWLGPMLAVLGACGVVYFLVLMMRPELLRRRQATTVLTELGVRGHFAALLWRLPHLIVLFAGSWVPFLFFDVNIPLAHALALIPPLMLVVALPISPQGFGTRDLFAQQLFVGYAHGTLAEQRAAVAAATLTFGCALTLVQAALSPLFMARARRLLHERAVTT
jgi:hypothetical protein